jgi:ATP-dependent DNA helicase RecG
LPGLTIEELREGLSRVRNRVLARVFDELGLIEQWGTGIQRMIDACTRAGSSSITLDNRILSAHCEPIGSK